MSIGGSIGGGPLAPLLTGGTAFGHASAGSASITVTILNSGQIIRTPGGAASDLSTGMPSNWNVDISTTVGNQWYVRCVVNSGLPSIGTTGTWLALSSNQGFGIGRGSPGTNTCNVTFQFSTDGGSTVIGAFTCDMTAAIT